MPASQAGRQEFQSPRPLFQARLPGRPECLFCWCFQDFRRLSSAHRDADRDIRRLGSDTTFSDAPRSPSRLVRKSSCILFWICAIIGGKPLLLPQCLRSSNAFAAHSAVSSCQAHTDEKKARILGTDKHASSSFGQEDAPLMAGMACVLTGVNVSLTCSRRCEMRGVRSRSVCDVAECDADGPARRSSWVNLACWTGPPPIPSPRTAAGHKTG